MKFYQNKKGAGDGFSWFVGTMVIFFIVLIFVVIYSTMGISKKVDVTVSADMKGAYFDNLLRQRMSGYFINYGIDGPNKGNLSYYFNNNDWKSVYSFLWTFNRNVLGFVNSYSTRNFMGLLFEDKYGNFCSGKETIVDYSTGHAVFERIIPGYIFESPIYFFRDNNKQNEKFWFLHQLNIEEVDCL